MGRTIRSVFTEYDPRPSAIEALGRFIGVAESTTSDVRTRSSLSPVYYNYTSQFLKSVMKVRVRLRPERGRGVEEKKVGMHSSRTGIEHQ